MQVRVFVILVHYSWLTSCCQPLLVFLLLLTGFDIECRLKGGWTPLMFACESGCNNIIQLLLNNGANPNSHKGNSIYVCAVYINQQNIHVVSSMHSGLSHPMYTDSFTPLMCLSTCKNHYKEDELGCSAKLLIEKGARVNSRDRYDCHVTVT